MLLILMKQSYFTVLCLIKLCHLRVKSALLEKQANQRLTLLLGANMSGNEKLKPLVIGKSKTPRCFKNVKSLPVEYEANSNAWVTTKIQKRHIRKLNSQFSRQKRNVAIIVDNCTAHNQPGNLKGIEIVLIPPKVTALLQPLDQGLIRFIANAESEEILSKDIIDPEPLETLLQIANEKGCSVSDVNAFVSIDNDIAICSQETVKALTSEFLEEKQNSSGEDSDVENMDQTPSDKT
ncbi:Tigger transposable element-derived protein 4 [Araneus ventricosus]|uniref:Tigger transposable element-derived protein 4 n=1 Tax=Araneus ventricosus TaxID=182803 RepID=A0A4Y2CLN2_ARAVE|nr:Tigger transposable element-derived protein 4 [Araneus ventricosus]